MTMMSGVGMVEAIFFLLVWYLAAVSMEETSVPVLPTFYEQGPRSLVFRASMEYVIPCGATGSPNPKYEWTKDGQSLKTLPENVAMYEEEGGHLFFSYFRSEDEGYYQCFAYNEHGRVASEITHLQQAKLIPYPMMAVKVYPGRVGEGLKLTCQPTVSVPQAEYSWQLTYGRSSNAQPLQLSARRTMDEQGNLYFAHIYATEEQDGALYKCNARNPNLWNSTAGSDSEIMIIDDTDKGDITPQLFFSSESPKVILLNTEATLRCFFKGKPTPVVSWQRVGLPMPYGRTRQDLDDTALIISMVQWEDKGDYECTGTNNLGQLQTHTITVDVQSEPVFEFGKELGPRTFRQGGTARFSCETTSEPPATVTWLINGRPVSQDWQNSRRHISGVHLVISDLCRECTDRPSDLMVVQCNASNIHGYALSTGTLNIIVCENEAEYDSVICSESTAEVVGHNNPGNTATKINTYTPSILLTLSLLTALYSHLHGDLVAV